MLILLLGSLGLVVFLLLQVNDLKRRIGRLEQRADGLTAMPHRGLVDSPPDLEEEQPAPEAPTMPAEPEPAAKSLPEMVAGKTGFLPETLPFFWLGAAALVASVGFLMVYVVQHDLLGPSLRVGIGLGFGAICLVAGACRPGQAAGLADALTATGLGAIYASLLAAILLFSLIYPPSFYALMAANTALALLLALARGPIIGYIGLAGGMATPAFLNTATAPAPLVFVFLAILGIGAGILARHRRWPGLLTTTNLAGFAWLLFWLIMHERDEPGMSAVPGLLYAGFNWLLAAGLWRRCHEGQRAGTHLPWLATLLSLGVIGIAAPAPEAETGFFSASTLAVLLMAGLGAGSFVLAGQDRRLGSLPLACWGLTLILLVWLGWDEAGNLGAVLLLGGGLVVYGALPAGLADWPGLPARWRIASPLMVLGLIGCARLVIDPLLPARDWGVLFAVLAILYAGLAGGRLRWGRDLRPAPSPLSPKSPLIPTDSFIAAAWGFAGLVLPLGTETRWSLLVPGALALASVRFQRACPSRLLPSMTGLFAITSAMAALPHLSNNGIPFDSVFGGIWPISVAAVLSILALACWQSAPSEPGNSYSWLHWTTGLLALLAAYWLARSPYAVWTGASDGWVLWRDNWDSGSAGLVTLGLGATSFGLWRFGRAAAIAGAGIIGAVLTGIWFLLGPLTQLNPLVFPLTLGSWPVLNGLLLLYGVPTLALLALSVMPRFQHGRPVIEAAAALLGLFWVSLTLRQNFQGTLINQIKLTPTEIYGYSALWFGYAALLLAAGVWRASTVWRLGGLLLMLATTAKIFLYDGSALAGLWRVLSFFGLGLALLCIGVLHQRLNRTDIAAIEIDDPKPERPLSSNPRQD